MCAGTKGPEMDNYISLLLFWFVCRNTNSVKRVMKSLIVGTTSLYIGRVRKCATDCPRIPYFGICLGEKTLERACILHLAYPSLLIVLLLMVALHKNLFGSPCFYYAFFKNLFLLCCQV